MNRPKDRRSAEGLLPRMEARPRKDGKTTYRFHPLGGKPINLGTDRVDAIRKVLDLTGKIETFGTVQWVWEKWQESANWRRLADGTQADYTTASKPLLGVFGSMAIHRVTSPMVAHYVRIKRADAPRRANIEKALMSNLFGYGIDLGVCETNPAKQVKPNHEEPKTEAPKAEVLRTFLAWLDQQSPQRRIIGMAAEFASLVGSRRVEFLDLAWPQVDQSAGVVRMKRAKQRGKKRGEVIEVVSITPLLADLLQRLRDLNRECLYVFPTRDNNAYSARGFKTLWQRSVHAAIENKAIEAGERFTFHDLRAYYASAHKEATGTLPDLHKNPETTARVYDRTKIVKRRAL